MPPLLLFSFSLLLVKAVLQQQPFQNTTDKRSEKKKKKPFTSVGVVVEASSTDKLQFSLRFGDLKTGGAVLDVT